MTVNGDTSDLLQQRWHHKRRFNTTSIDSKSLHVATYRNGYGTQFHCDSTCYFITFAYLFCVAAFIGLLSMIPVQSPRKPEEAPFLPWRGRHKHDASKATGKRKRRRQHEHRRGLVYRLEVWMYGEPEDSSSSGDEESAPSTKEVPVVVEKVLPEPPPKTFESIAVETDDSLLPPPQVMIVQAPPVPASDCVVVEDVDRLFDPLPRTPPSTKKPGIFSPASPRRARTEVSEGSGVAVGDIDLLPDLNAPPSRHGPTSPRRQSGTGGSGSSRRATVVGAVASPRATGESVLEAVERRQSMQKRADKRKEYAKSDIAHETLRGHELHTYEYLEFVREMLEGTTIKKVCQKSHKVVKRTFFITPDLSTVYWNSVGKKAWVVKKSSIETANIDKVIKGIQGNANLETKGKQEKQELYVSIMMKDGKRLDLEAKDEPMRQRLFLGFSQLATDKREEKKRKEAEALDAASAMTQAEAAGTDAAAWSGSSSQRPSADQERRSKMEEDNPKEWRHELSEGASVDANTNQDGQGGSDGG